MDINNRRTSTWIFMAVGLGFVLIILMQFFSLRNPNTKVAQMEQFRARKDLQFKNSPDSPIKKEDRDRFEKLDYFPVDMNYQLPAKLIKVERPDTLLLLTTTGERQGMINIGKLEFKMQGYPVELTAFAYLEAERSQLLFIPFRDLTSGVSTYGGGRYLEVDWTDNIVVDFNEAYNPYCVYNIDYSCPIPPRENMIRLEIRAGEKNYPYAEDI